MKTRWRLLRAFVVAGFLALAGANIVICCYPDPCDDISNEWLRWLLGCKALDSGASD